MITITDLQTSLLDLLHEIKARRSKSLLEEASAFISKFPMWPGRAAEHSGGNGLNPVPRTILTSFCVLN